MSESFDYDALAEAGIKTVTVSYSGESDEGYINEITSEPPVDSLDYGDELYNLIQDQAYDVLEREHGGWEINEGSSGHITINVKERTAFLHHGTNVVTQHYQDTSLDTI